MAGILFQLLPFVGSNYLTIVCLVLASFYKGKPIRAVVGHSAQLPPESLSLNTLYQRVLLSSIPNNERI